MGVIKDKRKERKDKKGREEKQNARTSEGFFSRERERD